MVDIFQLLKAIVRWKCVGKLLDSSPMYLEVLKLLRQHFGGIICPPGWGKVSWVGEKQYCYCRNPVAVLLFSGSVTAQLRRRQHLLTYYRWCEDLSSVTPMNHKLQSADQSKFSFVISSVEIWISIVPAVRRTWMEILGHWELNLLLLST